MAEVESFSILNDGATIRGKIHIPEVTELSSSLPAILLCRGILIPGGDAGGLFEELIQALVSAKVIVATFEHRCAQMILDDFDACTATHDVEDAAAVLKLLTERDDVDSKHIGVIGYCLGAIAATAVAQRHTSVAKLCLLGATTAANLAGPMTTGNGSPPHINPEHLPAGYLPSLANVDSPREAVAGEYATLIIHGAADQFVHPRVSFDYLNALQNARRSVEHVLVARADHTFTNPLARSACIHRIVRFFGAMNAAEPAQAAVANSDA